MSEANRTARESDSRTETNRIQVNASVNNIRSAEKLGLVDDGGESAAPLRVDVPRSQPGCKCSICEGVEGIPSFYNGRRDG